MTAQRKGTSEDPGCSNQHRTELNQKRKSNRSGYRSSGKLIGAAQRVPTPTGSSTILNAIVEGNVTVEEINAAMKAAANESFGYNEDKIVLPISSSMTYGSLFDATQTMVIPLDNGTTQVSGSILV